LYVPFTGSVFASTKRAVFVAETVNTAVPFGFRSVIFIDAIVEFVMSRETRCPSVPEKVAVALSPAFEIVTVTADPPGVIENETAAALPPRAAATTAARTAAQTMRVDVRRPTASHGRPPRFLVFPPNGVARLR
jgi:hypothetical protein